MRTTTPRGEPGSRTSRARRGALALALALALGTPGFADDETPETPEPAAPAPTAAEFEQFAKQLTDDDAAVRTSIQALRKLALELGPGQVREFTREEVMSLAARPAVAVELFRQTFLELPELRKADATGTATYLGRWRVAADLLADRATQTPASKVAVAFERLTQARLAALDKQAPDPFATKAAADTLRANAALAALPDAGWRAFLTECTLVPRDPEARAYTTWLDDELLAFLKRHPDDAPLVKWTTRFELAEGLAAFEAAPKTAGPMLLRGLNGLAAEGDEPFTDRVLLRRFNYGITVAKLAGLPTKATYRAKTIGSVGGYLRGEIPLESRWVARKVDGDQEEWGLDRDDDVGPGLSVTLWKYKTTTDYVDGEGKVVGGDNVGARLKRSLEDWRSEVAKVKKIAPSIGRLSKAIPGTKGFEVRGKGDADVEFRVREWYWKSDARPTLVFNLVVHQIGTGLDRDPETEFFLESLREAP